MKTEKNCTFEQHCALNRIRMGKSWHSKFGEIYVPEDGAKPRLVCRICNKEIDGKFQGRWLDRSSRAAVRRVVTGFVKSYDFMPDLPGDISSSSRDYLILKCKRKLEQKEREKGGGALCWSVQAIAEEIGVDPEGL